MDGIIGVGGSATVWRAHPVNHPRRTVAIKRLRNTGQNRRDIRRLQDEADVLAELDHLHIVRIIEVVEDDTGPVIVMQYAAGGSLADLLGTGRRLSPGELVAVAAPVASALAAAHERGLVHGDVKPSNVLLTSAGQPLLADFGVTRAEGTDGYLAPERLAGAEADARGDIYALGVLCGRALDADRPVPRRLAEVIARAVRPDPGARFSRAQDFAWALQGAVDHGDVSPPQPVGRLHAHANVGGSPDGDTRQFGPRPPKRTTVDPPRRRWPRRVLAGGVALVLGAIAVVAANRRATPPEALDCQPPPIPPGAVAGIAGDADGDGCDDGSYWFVDHDRSPSLVLVVRPTSGDRPSSYAFGRPGDVPVLGDWDCDGTDTLSLYRPSTGEVYRFDAWPRAGPLETGTAMVAAPDATARVEHDGGCDRLVIDASV